ncbi:MAG: phosphate acyltransferase PlsX [Bdellovibrio sp.]|nr:phosphate acyltransferase PlsX [Bdellovibrio sp.]
MHKLILDVMGGDYAPSAILEGAKLALKHLNSELYLVGDEVVINTQLKRHRFKSLKHSLNKKVFILHAKDNIEMSETISSVRTKPASSINIGIKLAAQDWKNKTPSAFISAGHSGALMASSLLHMGRLPQIERPAIAIKLPTIRPDGCVLIDVGANIDCKEIHLRDFALMGAVFAHVERKSAELPKVGLLSNGEERSKGNELTRRALELIENSQVFKGQNRLADFIGYVEGKDLFSGRVDVVVTDGFVGNLVLKSLEGLGFTVASLLMQAAKKNPLTSIGLVFSFGLLNKIKKKLDYAEYGAAPLLGVGGYAFVCHGRSKAKAIMNALIRSQNALESRYIEKLNLALQDQSVVRGNC